jgi:hypothetical protein
MCLFASCLGWWAARSVTSPEGFGDRVVAALREEEVRLAIGDEIAGRLAPVNQVFTAAKPLVAQVIAAALDTDVVRNEIRNAGVQLARNVLRVRSTSRAELDVSAALSAVQEGLRAVNPELADRIPASALRVPLSFAQNRTADRILDTLTTLADVWVFTALATIGTAALAVVIADDRRRALRAVGIGFALTGGVVLALSVPGPIAAAQVAPEGREDAAFVAAGTLTAPLDAVGGFWLLTGLVIVAVALTTGATTLAARVEQVRAAVRRRADRRSWRVAGWLGLGLLGVAVVRDAEQVITTLAPVVGMAAVYVAAVGLASALGLLNPVATARERTIGTGRSVALTGSAIGVAVLLVAGGTAAAVVTAVGRSDPAPATPAACNGAFELCLMPLRTVTFAGSHNAMSNTADGFLTAEHTESMVDQLRSGVRALLVDTYYGYPDGQLAGRTLVRTNFAGGADRDQLRAEIGDGGLAALDRLGGLTGAARTDVREVYFCHVVCELGATRAIDQLSRVRRFLEQNRSEVIHLMFEDYVRPEDTERILTESGLMPMVYVPAERPLGELTLGELLDAGVRVIVTSEKNGGARPWLLGAFDLFQETPYTFPKPGDFTCIPNRGGTVAPLFLVNHWLRPMGPPSPEEGRKVNVRAVLEERLNDCVTTRGLVPNIVAADFTALGDLFAVVEELNRATATVTGVTALADAVLDAARTASADDPALAAELAQVRRFAPIDAETVRRRLGPLADDDSFLRGAEIAALIERASGGLVGSPAGTG